MKKLNKYIMGALLAGTITLTFSSCDLDEYNPSGETADEVFVTPQGMEALVNELYYYLKYDFYGRQDPLLTIEASADIWQNIGNNYDYGNQFTRRIDILANFGALQNIWDYAYASINEANTIINRLDDVIGLSNDAKADFEGEARFMRSYYYWWLTEFFGDIELRTEETSSAVFTAERTDRKVIYDEVIIPDARKAADLLPVNPYKGNVGRSTRKAAKALLARVLLTRAQYEAEGSAEQRKFYEEALAAALDVVNNKASLGIKLYEKYDEIWQARNNKTNTEFLWVTTHSSQTNLNPQGATANRLHCYFSPDLINNNPGIINNSWEYPSENIDFKIMPTYYFLSLWEDWDLRYDVLFQEEFPTNSSRGYKWASASVNRFRGPESLVGKTVNNNETVFCFTKRHVTDEEKENVNYAIVGIDDLFETENITQFGGCKVRNPEDVEATTPYIAASFPRFMKYRIWDGDPNETLLTAFEGTFGYADVPVMRYAEMPLIAAECYIALDRTAEAAQIINSEIRNARVVKPGHSLSEAQVAASDMNIEWIMAERARELCGEWLRWFDVKRVYGSQGTYAATILGRNPSMTGDDCIQEYHTLWPIPPTFLDKLKNAEEFGQNPGY